MLYASDTIPDFTCINVAKVRVNKLVIAGNYLCNPHLDYGLDITKVIEYHSSTLSNVGFHLMVNVNLTHLIHHSNNVTDFSAFGCTFSRSQTRLPLKPLKNLTQLILGTDDNEATFKLDEKE